MNIKTENKLRILRMAILVKMFDTFTQLKLYESIIKQDERIDYESAQIFKDLFNIDLLEDPKTEDEEVNKCIELHSSLKFQIEWYTGVDFLNFDKENLMAFLNHSENKNFYLKMNHLMYSSVMESVCAYFYEQISKEEFFNCLNYFKSLTFPVLPLNLKRMIKCLQETEHNFITIDIKRNMRNKKNKGKNAKFKN